ncbi:hypothetical protein GCM10028771_36270 [Nocardioides marmoraquaticus]
MPAPVVPVLVVATGAVTLLAVLVGGAAETLGAWWPTVGLAVVTLLLTPGRRLVLVAVALLVVVLAAGLLGGRAPGTAAALAAVDCAEALLVALVVRRSADGRLDRLADLGPLLAGVAAGAVVGGLGVATILSSTSDDGFGAVFTVAGLAHAAALLVLVPPALLDWQRPWSQRRAGQVVPLAVVVGVVLVLAFSELTGGLTGLTLLVLPLPLVVAGAVRHDLRAITALLVWCAALVSATVLVSPNTFGPGAAGAAATTQVAQVYLVTLVLLVLPLALALRERDEAARRTRDSERTFRRAFTQSGLPVLLGRWDGATLRIGAASDACGGLLGREPAELAGLDVDALVHASGLLEALRGAPLADFPGWSGPLRLRDDPRRQVEAYAALLDVDGERGLLSLHLVDLTERLSLQQRLTDEQARSQAVMDTASSLIVITDTEGRVVTVNPETTRLTGWTADELVGRPLWELVVAPRDRQKVEDAVTQVLPIPRSGELRLRTRSGAERTVVYSHAVHQGTDDAPATFVFSGSDVTEARASAEMVEHLLRSVTSIAFVGTDLDGTVTLFSTGAERLFGLRADQALGRGLGTMLAEVGETGQDGQEGLRRGVPLTRLVGSGSAVEGSPRTHDWLALPQDRPPVRVSMTCNPVRSAAGTQHGYLFVARDVTDTRRNQEIMVSALRREREVVTRLQELDRAKDDFISTVSHELRTPMSSIIGCAEMLADGMAGELHDSQQQLVDVVIRNGARLLGLADDLLTLATFDRGTPAQPGAHLDLRHVVRESLGAVRPHPDDDRLRWEVDLPDAPVDVVGEASHLERAVTNLLTNAVKFTPDGGSVSVALRLDPGVGTATVTVTDTGRGIPESDLEHVFDRFFRASEVQRHAIQGTGLGLSIVKQIVERHDGSIAVRSRHGEGTSVAVTIPLARHPQV